MSDGSSDSIIMIKIQLALKELLATYQSERAGSQRDNDTRFTEYWDSACQTIYDVAAALKIPFEEQPSKRRPHKTDSITPLGSVDVQHPSNGLSEYRQHDTF